jgi:hypothetical protein
MSTKNKATISVSKELHAVISKIADYTGLSLEQVVLSGTKLKTKQLINDYHDPKAYEALATSMKLAEEELSKRYHNVSRRSKHMRELNHANRVEGEKLQPYILYSPFKRPTPFKAYPSTVKAQGRQHLADLVFVD